MAMSKQEASQKISDLLAQAQAAISEAERIADETGVGFSFSVAYGMGGYYTPVKKDGEENDEWESSDEGWVSSSQNC